MRLNFFGIKFNVALAFVRLALNRVHIKWCAWQFRRWRADYYLYLSEMIQLTDGARTLGSIFRQDALRHAGQGARGTLSAEWSRRFPICGGDLFSTWSGTLPDVEIAIIREAQYAGAGALPQALMRLSHVVRLVDTSTREFLSTMTVACVAALFALGSVLVIPFFSAQQIGGAFSFLHPQFYGLMARRFFSLADWLGRYWSVVPSVMFASGIILYRSLAVMTGRIRLVCDRFGIWRLYCTVQSIRFLALLSLLLKQRGHHGTRLREALAAQRRAAVPWLRWHLDQMIARLDAGLSATQSMNTGLIDRQTWWYFTDMVQSVGLDLAMDRTCKHIESQAVARMRRHAAWLRWALLIGSMLVVLSMGLLHYRVIDELRQSLSLQLAI